MLNTTIHVVTNRDPKIVIEIYTEFTIEGVNKLSFLRHLVDNAEDMAANRRINESVVIP